MKQMLYHWSSPIGWLQIKADNKALQAIHFLEQKPGKDNPQPNDIIRRTITQLEDYFIGSLKEFSLHLDPQGTDFQQTVWQQLCNIPYGQTSSYGQVAEMLGDAKKVRAVGRANGQNPISIVIPCHRVIGANGDLIGYGGGIKRKRRLLQHEGALLL
ncbi:MAG TPA: methylated-DNA--[protein]-cysteine S-methyltransferase [Fodinibius sp.]|nr:methylated-DNA--[protein]-cysteine S-methyltransferase [Fodinibius sp.]